MKTEDIIKANAASLDNVSVELDHRFPTVCIKDHSGDGQEDIFLQGDDAVRFEEEFNELWNAGLDLTKDEIIKHLAISYVDCIWG